MASSNTYQSPAIQTPTIKTLQGLAKKYGLQVSDDRLQQYQDVMTGLLPCFTVVDTLPEPTLPVKYPRTCGYRPSAEENKHNAWYWKCDIKGANQGILNGKTVAIKDNVAVAGVPMMNGSRVLEGYVPEFDASIVTSILDAGGHIIGKAANEDMCVTGASFANAKGVMPHPLDPTRNAGGSSSGSAVLVANGDVDLAIGSDQGGSVRIPCSWCGLVGLKPTFGLVPYTGGLVLEETIDHLGPMTKTVSDAALLLEAIAGKDGYDHRQPTVLEVPKYTEMLTGSIEGMTIGFLQEGFDFCTEEVNSVVKSCQGVFGDLKANVEFTSMPEHKTAKDIWMTIFISGVWNSMLAGEGIGTGHKKFYETSMAEYLRRGLKSACNQHGEMFQFLTLLSDYIQDNYGNKFYHKAQNLQRELNKTYDKLLEKFDVLVMPTLPYTATKLPAAEEDFTTLQKRGQGMINNCSPFNASGHPAITINAGFLDGLPVGVMIVGKHFDDGTVLKVAHALEQALNAQAKA